MQIIFEIKAVIMEMTQDIFEKIESIYGRLYGGRNFGTILGQIHNIIGHTEVKKQLHVYATDTYQLMKYEADSAIFSSPEVFEIKKVEIWGGMCTILTKTDRWISDHERKGVRKLLKG